MSEKLTESLKRLVLLDADLTRLIELQEQATNGSTALTVEDSIGRSSELVASLIAGHRQVLETLIVIAEELDRRS